MTLRRGVDFYGVSLTPATAFWCDMCGCLLTVADRFEYVQVDGSAVHADCVCHEATAAHNAAT